MSAHDCNCGAHSGDPEHLTLCPMRGPRAPTPPSAGAKTISQLRDEEMGDDYEFAPVSPKGLETMRYGPTREHLRAVRIAAENERRGEVPNGLRRTLENCLTDAFQAGVTASNAQVAERVAEATEGVRKERDALAQAVREYGSLVEEAFKEGYNEGIGDGHPLSRGADSDKAWKRSNAIDALAAIPTEAR